MLSNQVPISHGLHSRLRKSDVGMDDMVAAGRTLFCSAGNWGSGPLYATFGYYDVFVLVACLGTI